MENERKNKIEYHKEGDYYVPNLVVQNMNIQIIV